MGTVYGTLFRESSIPGLSTIFSTKSKPRKLILTAVFTILAYLTVKDLLSIVIDYFHYPITVSVLVADSRVLPFPSVTICNLNAVHRGRFCSNKRVEKPGNVEHILCASLNDLLEVCKIHEVLDELVSEGERICTKGKKRFRGRGGQAKPAANRPATGRGRFGGPGPPSPLNITLEEVVGGNGTNETVQTGRRAFGRRPTVGRRRGKRDIELNLKTIISTFKAIQSGNFSGGIFESFTEAGGLVDTIILHIASLYGINVNTTKELLPALFVKAFTEVTGCRVGTAGNEDEPGAEVRHGQRDPINEALENLTTIFSVTSEKLITQLTTCTGPWVNGLLGYNATTATRGETPWFILLDIMQSWLINLARKNPKEAKLIGHQAKDMIKTCYFAGKKCDIERDFKSEFYSQHGNCFSYNTDEMGMEVLHSGFTGPQFGLELLITLETEQYMPTSREAGLKIVVHDRGQKADPDQDAINIPAGVVTYVGVQMLNISRLPKPYHDKCIDKWAEGDLKEWALALNHDTYTTQTCLKICLQKFVLQRCQCWTQTAPWPPFTDEPQCSERRNKEQASCVEFVRQMYFKEEIDCECPPRCSDRIYEKFLSSGQETRQCSAIPSNSDSDHQGSTTADEKENHAKVIVYFHSLSYNEIRQEKKYTVEGLLGAIGGILGVYLGISFFAIYEVFEVMFRGCTMRGRPVRGDTESAAKEDGLRRLGPRRRRIPFPYVPKSAMSYQD